MQDVLRQAAALESTLRKWETRTHRLLEEAADADLQVREQTTHIERLRIHHKLVLEEIRTSDVQHDLCRAAAANAQYQELSVAMADAQALLAELQADAQQMRVDATAAARETEVLQHRMFLCDCMRDLMRTSKFWDTEHRRSQRIAAHAQLRASDRHAQSRIEAAKEVLLICNYAVDDHQAQPQDGNSRHEQQPNLETRLRESKASQALTEKRKAESQADLLHACLLGLSKSDDLSAQCMAATETLQRAIIDEQSDQGALAAERQAATDEMEHVKVKLATGERAGALETVACYEEACERAATVRQALARSGQRVREQRAVVQKLDVQQQASLHMNKLIEAAYKHEQQRKHALSEQSCRSGDPCARIEYPQDLHQECDSRESTLTVAGGIPCLPAASDTCITICNRASAAHSAEDSQDESGGPAEVSNRALDHATHTNEHCQGQALLASLLLHSAAAVNQISLGLQSAVDASCQVAISKLKVSDAIAACALSFHASQSCSEHRSAQPASCICRV
jgi:hypothetical protein